MDILKAKWKSRERVNCKNCVSPEALLKAVRNDIDDFASGMEQYDDITMVVLKIKA